MLIVIALSIIKVFDHALYKVIKSKYITDVNGPQIFIYMADYFFESFWMIVRQNLIRLRNFLKTWKEHSLNI